MAAISTDVLISRLGLFPTSRVQSNKPQKWGFMARNSAGQYRDPSGTLLQKPDSPQITELIEQLERDLKETRKNAGKER